MYEGKGIERADEVSHMNSIILNVLYGLNQRSQRSIFNNFQLYIGTAKIKMKSARTPQAPYKKLEGVEIRLENYF